MSFISRLRAVDESEKSLAVEKLVSASTPDFDFFLMIVLSILMATFGLLLDSTAVVIGSMLIAPMLYPVLSFSIGVAMADYKLIQRSLHTITRSFIIAVGAAALVTIFFAYDYNISGEVLSRARPSLAYFLVAVISGFAVSYALVKPKLSETLPGVAVSVALIPPLAVVGFGIAKLEWAIVAGATTLFIINIFGIVFAGIVSFALMNIYAKRSVAERTLEKEEERVEREHEEVREIEIADKLS